MRNRCVYLRTTIEITSSHLIHRIPGVGGTAPHVQADTLEGKITFLSQPHCILILIKGISLGKIQHYRMETVKDFTVTSLDP